MEHGLRRCGRAETPQPGVFRGEVQLAFLVLHPVTGEVHQQKVVRSAVGEELLHRQGDVVSRLVEQYAHFDPADRGIPQHPRVPASWPHQQLLARHPGQLQQVSVSISVRLNSRPNDAQQ
jgi:hypothetical protein